MRMVKDPYVTYGTAPSSVATRRVCKEAPGRCDGLTLMQVAALDWSHFRLVSGWKEALGGTQRPG